MQGGEFLVWWELETDDGVRKITQQQMEALLEAEARGARFVLFDDALVNLSFVRGAERKVRVLDEASMRFCPLDESDRRFLVREVKILQKGAK